MVRFSFVKITPENFDKLGEIWDMQANAELADKFRAELCSFKRVIFALKSEEEYLAEAALVFDMNDPDYTSLPKKLYLSHLVVKESERGKGYGTIMLEYLANQAEDMGCELLTVGVDIDNFGALKFYVRHGFKRIIKADEDKDGKFLKLERDLRERCGCCGGCK